MPNFIPNRPGQRLGAGSVLDLFIENAMGLFQTAYKQAHEFTDKTTIMNVDAGKSWEFDIIGRIAAAADHTPGAVVTVNAIQHNQIAIALDNVTANAVFLSEFDKLLNAFDLVEPYTSQIAQSLAAVSNGRMARTFVNASRVTAAPYPGGPVPSYAWNANMATDPTQMETGIYAAKDYLSENDISGMAFEAYMPYRAISLMARAQILDQVIGSGSADRSMGTVGKVAGLDVTGVNSIPRTNFTTDTFAKYNGNFTTTQGFVANKMAVGTLKRRGQKIVVVDKPENIGHLMVGSQLEGHGILRPECSFELATAVRV